jgi:hypothetical protein
VLLREAGSYLAQSTFLGGVRRWLDLVNDDRGARMKVSTVVRAVPASNGKTRLEVAGSPSFEMNPVAATIWEKLAEGLPTQEIIDYIAREFRVPEERISRDVVDFIEILKENLLISDDPELVG